MITLSPGKFSMQKQLVNADKKSKMFGLQASSRILIAVSLAFLTGCSQMHMAVPKDLAGNTVAMPVTIKKAGYIFDINKISFGPFAASKFHLGWDHNSTLSASVYSSNDFSKQYDFILKQDKAAEWKCECGVKAAQREMKGKLLGGDLYIPVKNNTSLSCTFKESQNDSNWTLDLSKDAKESDRFTGELSGGGERIQIESIDEIEGQHFKTGDEPSGYVYRKGERTIGALETLDPGRVWISTDSTGGLRPQLALASTALIVFQTVLKSVEKEK